MRIIITLTNLVFLLVLATSGLLVAKTTPPAKLTETCDPVLQRGLEQCLVSLKLKKATDNKILSIALVDITNPSAPRIAYANPNEMMYAASLPKIAILLGAFERVGSGEMELDSKTREQLTLMIRNSSNQAATKMLNRVGKSYLADLLQSPRYRLYDPVKNGGLWVGKEYSKANVWKRDPLHNLSHGATVLQVARFYYMMQTGQLVSPELSQQMKSILSKPAINHKFVKGLMAVHPNSLIYRKSGTWRDYHSDSAIIEHDGRRYIAVALAKSNRGGQWLTDLIVAMDELIFKSAPQTVAAEKRMEAVRSQLEAYLLQVTFDDSFRHQLRQAMENVFGPDGTYGVFVRSDTNVEDLPGFTGAGLNKTIAHVVGFENILAAIPKVWASPFSQRAFSWRQALMEQPQHVYASVLLMRSVPAEKSGVMVTRDIDTGDPEWLTIAVNEGIGGAVDGQAAESLRVHLLTGEVRTMAQATAPWRRVLNSSGGIAKEQVRMPERVLKQDEIKLLISLAHELPLHYPSIVDAHGNPAPADIEFGFVQGGLQLFQIRPFLESTQARSNQYLNDLDNGRQSRLKQTVNLNEPPA